MTFQLLISFLSGFMAPLEKQKLHREKAGLAAAPGFPLQLTAPRVLRAFLLYTNEALKGVQ